MSILVLVGLFLFFLDYLLLYFVARGVPYILVTTSFEVVVLVRGSLDAQFGDLLVCWET